MAEPKPVFIKEDQDALRHYVMGQASASLNPEEAIKIYKMSFDSVRLQAELSPPHPSDIIFFEGLANDVYDKLSLDNPESCCAAKDLLDSVDECYYLSKKNDLNLFGLALFPSMDVSDAEIALYKKQSRLFHKLVKHGTFETLSNARNMLLDFYQKSPYQGLEGDDDASDRTSHRMLHIIRRAIPVIAGFHALGDADSFKAAKALRDWQYMSVTQHTLSPERLQSIIVLTGNNQIDTPGDFENTRKLLFTEKNVQNEQEARRTSRDIDMISLIAQEDPKGAVELLDDMRMDLAKQLERSNIKETEHPALVEQCQHVIATCVSILTHIELDQGKPDLDTLYLAQQAVNIGSSIPNSASYADLPPVNIDEAFFHGKKDLTFYKLLEHGTMASLKMAGYLRDTPEHYKLEEPVPYLEKMLVKDNALIAAYDRLGTEAAFEKGQEIRHKQYRDTKNLLHFNGMDIVLKEVAADKIKSGLTGNVMIDPPQIFRQFLDSYGPPLKNDPGPSPLSGMN